MKKLRWKGNFARLKKALIYIKNIFINSDDNMYLTINSLIDKNNIMTGLNNIALRKVTVKPDGYDKMYVVKEFMRDKLY